MVRNKFRWLYLIGFFLILALPLLNVPPWFSPPDWGKTIVFRIVLSILIFIFLWQILSEKTAQTFSTIVQNIFNRESKIFWGFWLLVALFGVFFLATVFSLDRNFSFWGSPYRAGGFLNFASYIIFAILAFLILRKKDWQKIWDFAILIGVLVSIIAIFQWQGLFEEIFVSFEGRPPATIGGPIFLAIYLLLLSFLTLSFGIKAERLYKKFFYFGSLFLFIFVILLTYTRAAFLGLFVGILYFLFFYPAPARPPERGETRKRTPKKESTKKIIWLKVFALVTLILVAYGVYYLNTATELPQFFRESKFLMGLRGRLLIKRVFQDPRISGWKVSWQALKNKPILGYGPENFSIGFDKFYDPALPNIEMMPGTVHSWWDRAHNFIFDISITAGIPALIIYLSLFGVLFWQFQKLKNQHKSVEIGINQRSIIAHGAQATFLAYLTANFFSFDTFSTYLISFLLIGYSLHLICSANQPNLWKPVFRKLVKHGGVIMFFFFICLIWFIWNYNIKPLQTNKEIKIARFQVEKGNCQQGLSRMENLLDSHTFLDHYLRLNYIKIITDCIKKSTKSTQKLLAQKAVQILKENVKIRPLRCRDWLLLGGYTNILIEMGQKELKDEANYYFEKANLLSPRRQGVFTEWIKTDLFTDQYQKAKEKSQKCIDLNPELGECWWYRGLSRIYLGEVKEAEEDINTARKKRCPIDSEASLLYLAKAYTKTKNYQKLKEAYKKLIKIEPNNPQYHTSLAYVYKELGEKDLAKKEALKVLELSPESREEVEEFLRSLE